MKTKLFIHPNTIHSEKDSKSESRLSKGANFSTDDLLIVLVYLSYVVTITGAFLVKIAGIESDAFWAFLGVAIATLFSSFVRVNSNQRKTPNNDHSTKSGM